MPDGLPAAEKTLSAERMKIEREKERTLGGAKVYAKPRYHGTLGNILKNIFTFGTAYTPKTVPVESKGIPPLERIPTEKGEEPEAPRYVQKVDITKTPEGETITAPPARRTYARPGTTAEEASPFTQAQPTLADVATPTPAVTPTTEGMPEFGWYADPTTEGIEEPKKGQKFVELKIRDAGGEKRWVQVPEDWAEAAPGKTVNYSEIEKYQ